MVSVGDSFMLHLSLSEQSNPLYIQIYQQIKQQIRSGILPDNYRLPSKRQLASQLGISINTVTAAYSQLVSEGFLIAKPQRGFFVCHLDELIQSESFQNENIEDKQISSSNATFYSVDFSINDIAQDKFPFHTWRKAMNKCFNEYDPSLLTSTPPQGDLKLRQAIAQYLYQARGVNCTADQIIIGAGNDNLLQMLSYILDNSCTIGMENPVYHKAMHFFQRMGHVVHSFYIDEQGLPVEPLESYDNIAVYVTPSHQFPLGITMPINRRINLLNWTLDGTNRYIIEDDYDSEFRYNSRPIPALQSLDKNGRVIYLGTFSKSIAPSLRISYMVLPRPLLKQYLEQYLYFPSAVSRFEQAVLHEFIVSGHFETHLNKMRKLYRTRGQELIQALSIFGSQLQLSGEKAGFYIVAQLKNGLTETQMCQLAEAQGVKVYPISPYFNGSVPKEHHSKVLLGFSSLDSTQMQKGVNLLYKAWLS